MIAIRKSRRIPPGWRYNSSLCIASDSGIHRPCNVSQIRKPTSSRPEIQSATRTGDAAAGSIRHAADLLFMSRPPARVRGDFPARVPAPNRYRAIDPSTVRVYRAGTPYIRESTVNVKGDRQMPAPFRTKIEPGRNRGDSDQAPLISILRAFASAAFGSFTISTPFAKLASTFSTSIVCGIEKLRVNRFQLRSRRW